MKCTICKNEMREVFSSKVRDQYEAHYYKCSLCGFLQVVDPVWLTEAYKEPINLSDVGYVSRNILLSQKTLTLFILLFGKGGIFLDYAAGYGVFVRLMRDYGLDFYWDDLYTENIFARGFKYKDQNIDAITCFECFEHFVNPIKELEKMLKISKNIFFSTHLLPDPMPIPNQWWYYGLEHGQHIAFYSLRTFEFLAEKYSLNFYTNGVNLHLFTKKKINPFIFRFLMSGKSSLLANILKRFSRTKINSDFELLRR